MRIGTTCVRRGGSLRDTQRLTGRQHLSAGLSEHASARLRLLRLMAQVANAEIVRLQENKTALQKEVDILKAKLKEFGAE